MARNYPNNADGDALRLVARNGSNTAKPMTIDFQVALPTEQAAKAMARVARKLGYRVSVYGGSKDGWTCECSTRTMATYQIVAAIQKELGELSQKHGGYPDGWGTFGNK